MDIALEQGMGPVTTPAIAGRQKISKKYLEQLLTTLKKKGLIKSIRGPQGGYVLGHSADKITVGDIIRTLEGPIAPVDCISEINPGDCARAQFCVTRQIWLRLRDAASEILDAYTLADLMEDPAVCRESISTRKIRQR